MTQQIVTELIEHISHSHEHMARVLEAERHVAVRMSQMVDALPDRHPEFGGMGGLMESAHAVTGSVVNYLNSIAELQETIAITINSIMKELSEEEEE
ncbi:nucleoside-diphosphate sugar epimerase [Paenibacillus mendelii]|uniref:Nucleoside-diphosphate sugar epimerase n=1 Tax=Paenibacillus mendelii TaxID=206163 RepID=A0ABV6J8Y7_9BACL|nr:nucleoside-diphosphate sugar epimerase [Paenibacillus mendelii]MCQ6559693.1 nucleoside-diphosphate sugar epimerase [Paenibacillus mendelii]